MIIVCEKSSLITERRNTIFQLSMQNCRLKHGNVNCSCIVELYPKTKNLGITINMDKLLNSLCNIISIVLIGNFEIQDTTTEEIPYSVFCVSILICCCVQNFCIDQREQSKLITWWSISTMFVLQPHAVLCLYIPRVLKLEIHCNVLNVENIWRKL